MGDWFGAIDWSGATVLREATDSLDLYGCALAAVPGVEVLSEGLRRVRSVYAMRADKEFHAHGMAEDVQLAVLQEAISHGLRIAAIRCDKKALDQQMKLPKPGDFASSVALVLLERCLPSMNLASLVFDEDIQREQRRRAFLTEVRRVARTGPNPARLRTRFVRSRSHDLAQVADVVVYNVIRDAHQAIRLPELQECISRLLIAEGTILIDLPGE